MKAYSCVYYELCIQYKLCACNKVPLRSFDESNAFYRPSSDRCKAYIIVIMIVDLSIDIG